MGDIGVESDVAVKSSVVSKSKRYGRRHVCLFTSVSSLGAGLPSLLHMYGTETKKNSFTFASAGV